jgi:hypothetical protein
VAQLVSILGGVDQLWAHPWAAANGSLTTVSRNDIRLKQHSDSSALGLVRRWLLIGYFPFHLLLLGQRRVGRTSADEARSL